MVEIRVVELSELKRSIGRESTSMPIEIEKGAIRKFVVAVGARNPSHPDNSCDDMSECGAMTAPEDMLFGIEFGYTPAPVECPALRLLDGGGEWDFLLPVKSGDTLTFKRKLIEVSERETSAGRTYFMTSEIIYTNQEGETAARARLTDISY